MPPNAQQLYDRSVDEVRHGRVRQALATLLETLAADPTHRPAYEAAGKICRILGSTEDAELFEALSKRPADPEGLFRLGYRLADQGRPDVAVRLLERSLAGLPADTGVRRELAFARLQSRDFEGCLRALIPLEDDPDLSETERLEVLLTQAEAALLAGRREVSRDFLERAEDLVPEDEQRDRLDALHAQLGRASLVPDLRGAGLREWHFIQHAGVILKTAGGWFEDDSRGGRFDVLALRGDMVAFLLQRLAQLFERFGLKHDSVAPASELAAPLAHALALRLGAELLPDLSDRAGRTTLLVAASAGELLPHVAQLARNRNDLRVYALNLDWEHDAPVCPDVAGVLARRVLLPWESRFALDESKRQMKEVAPEARDPADVGRELRELMDNLPWDDGGAAREEFENLYAPWRGQLVLANETMHPARRRFTALSPFWPPPREQGGDGRISTGRAPDQDPDEPEFPNDPDLPDPDLPSEDGP
jgi:tetratricopeptide (TPR) repeat protein